MNLSPSHPIGQIESIDGTLKSLIILEYGSWKVKYVKDGVEVMTLVVVSVDEAFETGRRFCKLI